MHSAGLLLGNLSSMLVQFLSEHEFTSAASINACIHNVKVRALRMFTVRSGLSVKAQNRSLNRTHDDGQVADVRCPM